MTSLLIILGAVLLFVGFSWLAAKFDRCMVGWHRWEYANSRARYCLYCPKIQTLRQYGLHDREWK